MRWLFDWLAAPFLGRALRLARRRAADLAGEGAELAAESFARRALGLSERRFGRAAPETAVVLDELAGLIAAQGRHEEAEPHYRRALAILERALGAGHPSVLAALAKLRSVYAARGDRPDEQDAALYRGFFICPRCGGRLMHEKDTSSGTEMRSYYCPACRWMKDEDRGPALWAVMSEARRDDPG